LIYKNGISHNVPRLAEVAERSEAIWAKAHMRRSRQANVKQGCTLFIQSEYYIFQSIISGSSDQYIIHNDEDQ